MSRKHAFLNAVFSEQFKSAYAALQSAQQEGVDKAVLALMKQRVTPGMRIKPIEPDKYYLEARINAGDRLTHRVEAGVLHVVDVVTHDEINRFGRRPKSR